ncbi:glycosyltransferase family 4 protein [Bradyrhizobium sp. WSM 1738]|uniref:glycosyltransferase family 4 protein n=1 Tax=Bradyrhizobium hereditatis TaxID=2821405 RepID=UPI001CE31F87|nr:glycosyltransferase family 4 protein [Bradyrhizobium hereditatis]MCA6119203.1 glycosyltransferase family 4 protein [Bradyrhizobium hereditatis]
MNPPCRRLRILMTTDAVGGVWVYASTLARALCQMGMEVSLVTLGPAPRGDQLQSIAGTPGLTVEITDLSLEWLDPEGRDFHRAADRLAAIENRVKPDIVHLNSYREAISTWRAPVLVVAHSCVRSWWLACRGEEPTESRWLAYMANVHAGLSAADRWIAPTHSFLDKITELYQPESAGLVIHNGVEEPASRTSKQPFILAAGRQWDEAKNLSILADISPCLAWPVRTNGPLGIGRDDRHAERSPELSHAALLGTMRCASVLASPAVYEPFGLTVLEAATAGCALVLSDIPTFRELWDGAALFVEPRDRDEWQAVLACLTHNDALRHDLQKRAALKARRYRLKATAAAYAGLYRELAGSARAAVPRPHQVPAEVQP